MPHQRCRWPVYTSDEEQELVDKRQGPLQGYYRLTMKIQADSKAGSPSLESEWKEAKDCSLLSDGLPRQWRNSPWHDHNRCSHRTGRRGLFEDQDLGCPCCDVHG